MYQHSGLIKSRCSTSNKSDAYTLDGASKPAIPTQKPQSGENLKLKSSVAVASKPEIVSQPKPSTNLNIWQINYNADTGSSSTSDIKPIPRPRPRKTPPPRPPPPSRKPKVAMQTPPVSSNTVNQAQTTEPLIDLSSEKSTESNPSLNPTIRHVDAQSPIGTAEPGVFRMGEEAFIKDIDRRYEATAGFEEKHFCQLCEDGVFHMH